MATRDTLGTTPRSKPAGTPRDRPRSTYRDITLEAVLSLERAVGGLETAVRTLEQRAADQGAKLDTISKQIYAALVILAALSVLGGFIFNKLGDLAVQLSASHITH